MLSFIICTYKRPLLFQKCFACAAQTLDVMDSEIVVINDSEEYPVSVPQHPRVHLYNNPGQGTASARNLGAAKSSGDMLLFVDDDIEFDLKNVQAIVEEYKKRPPACYNSNWRYSDEMYRNVEKTQFGRFLIKYNLVDYRGWVRDINWQDDLFESRKVAGFFMLVPKAAFDQIGGFNEEFTNQGTEDDELCKRWVQTGVKMYVDPKNFVFHNELDRISLEARANRYYNGAINRRTAFDLGDDYYKIPYTASKKIILKLILPFEPLLFFAAKCIPNIRALDFLYFKISHVIIAISIYKGYTKK